MPDTSETLGTLIDQLTKTNQQANNVSKIPDKLTRDRLEQFVIDSAGELVQESLDALRVIKNTVITAPNNRDVEALAGLVTATATTIETLNRMVLAEKRGETAVKIKQMELDAQGQMFEEELAAKVQLRREDVFKSLATGAMKALREKSVTVELEPTN